MKLGVLINLDSEQIEEKFAKLREMGFNSCQLCCWRQRLMTGETAEKIKGYCQKYDIDILEWYNINRVDKHPKI